MRAGHTREYTIRHAEYALPDTLLDQISQVHFRFFGSVGRHLQNDVFQTQQLCSDILDTQLFVCLENQRSKKVDASEPPLAQRRNYVFVSYGAVCETGEPWVIYPGSSESVLYSVTEVKAGIFHTDALSMSKNELYME